MGRRRQRDKHLPQRVYLDHGTYWFRPNGGKAVNLGRDLADAITRYASLIGTAWSGRTLGDVIDRYRTQVLPTKRSAQTRADEGKALDRLKRIYGQAIRWGIASSNPVRGLDYGERGGKRRKVELEEVQRLRDLAGERMRVA